MVAHGSFPQGRGERALWLSRYAAYAIASGADAEQVSEARTAVDTGVNMLSPEQDETILHAAGFSGIRLFYAAFTWRGWIAYA